MALGEKQFAKTFDIKKDQFALLKGKVDLDTLERIRFLDSQLNLLYSKMERLQKMVAEGLYPFGSEEAPKRILALKRRYGLLESKMNLYGILIEEVKSGASKMKTTAEALATTQELSQLVVNLNELEKTSGELSKPRIRGIFMNIAQTVESLRWRVNNIEGAIATLKDIYFGSKVEKFKAGIREEYSPTVTEQTQLSKILKDLKNFEEKLKE